MFLLINKFFIYNFFKAFEILTIENFVFKQDKSFKKKNRFSVQAIVTLFYDHIETILSVLKAAWLTLKTQCNILTIESTSSLSKISLLRKSRDTLSVLKAKCLAFNPAEAGISFFTSICTERVFKSLQGVLR